MWHPGPLAISSLHSSVSDPDGTPPTFTHSLPIHTKTLWHTDCPLTSTSWKLVYACGKMQTSSKFVVDKTHLQYKIWRYRFFFLITGEGYLLPCFENPQNNPQHVKSEDGFILAKGWDGIFPKGHIKQVWLKARLRLNTISFKYVFDDELKIWFWSSFDNRKWTVECDPPY